MGFWKKLDELFGTTTLSEKAVKEYGDLSTKKTFEEKAKVEFKKGEAKDYRSGTLYLKINKYTYLVTPNRSELARYLNLKEGDIVLLTAEKIVEKMG